MQKIIGVTELQRNFRSVFDEVAKENVPYVLTRGSRPEVAMIPYEDYLRFQALQEETALARFDALTARMAARNGEFTDEEIAADVEQARDELQAD
jgi:prevent-host-death family protein